MNDKSLCQTVQRVWELREVYSSNEVTSIMSYEQGT